MQKAAKDLIGKHDFTSFAASGGQIVDKVRTIYYVNITSDPDNKKIIFDFIGNGFLYNMVRILVGTLEVRIRCGGGEGIAAVNAGRSPVGYLFSALRTGDQGHKMPPFV